MDTPQKCERCGSDAIKHGTLFENTFCPSHTKRWVIISAVKFQATACTSCGHVQLWINQEACEKLIKWDT